LLSAAIDTAESDRFAMIDERIVDGRLMPEIELMRHRLDRPRVVIDRFRDLPLRADFDPDWWQNEALPLLSGEVLFPGGPIRQ
jgi:hypothetical protein